MELTSGVHQATAPIRTRVEADVPACAALLREVYAIDGYPVEGVADAVNWMHPEGLMEAWVAGRPGEVLGHAAVCEPRSGDAAAAMLVARSDMSMTDIVVLARLFVGPGARNNGTGRRLAVAAFAYAAETKRRAVLDVIEKDSAAIRMYERLGCVLLGSTSHQVADGRVFPALCFAAPGVVDNEETFPGGR